MVRSAKFESKETFDKFAKEHNAKELLTVKLNRVRDFYTTQWIKAKSIRVYYEQ